MHNLCLWQPDQDRIQQSNLQQFMGEVNRFQRLTPAIEASYDDNQSSIPVPFASAKWGSLPAFESVSAAST